MTPGARYGAAIGILDDWLAGAPVEKTLSNWARRNRFAGSKDRAAVRDIVFDCLRQLRRFCPAPGPGDGRAVALAHAHSLGGSAGVEEVFTGTGYAPDPPSAAERETLAGLDAPQNGAAGLSLPDWLFGQMVEDHGDGLAEIAEALMQRAPVDLRVNTQRGSVAEAQATLAREGIETAPVAGVDTALRVTQNPRRVAGSAAFRDGMVELQDAASQALVQLLPLRPGQKVLDYCAGGGGKTLAMAAREPAARYAAWDISPARLAAMAPRVERAGASVALLPDRPARPTYDVVLVDAPCSGSGAWRRNPEGKWRLTAPRLQELAALQAQILVNAAACLRPRGTLVYATCSVLQQENQCQIDRFLSEQSDFSVVDSKSFALGDPGDGFFCAILAKQL